MNAREVVNMIAVLIFLLEWAERFFLLSYNKSMIQERISTIYETSKLSEENDRIDR